MATENIVVSIELADKAANQALSNFLASATKTDKAVKKVGETSKTTFGEITVGIGKAIGAYDIFTGNIAANIVVKAFETLYDAAKKTFEVIIVDSIKAAEESEKLTRQLNVSLAQSGNYSKEAAAGFQEWIGAMERATTIDDEVITQNVALLESLTHLDQDGLKRASTAAIDLSAALGKDLKETTEAVAKAANGNVRSLKEMGIVIDDVGSKSYKFEQALKTIEDRVGGASNETIKTFSGTTRDLANQFDNLQGEIGGIITQNPVVISTIQAVTDTLVKFGRGVNDNQSTLRTFVGEGLITLIDGMGKLVLVTDIIVTSFRYMGRVINEIFERIGQATYYVLSFIDKEAEKAFKNTTEYLKKYSDETEKLRQNGTFAELKKAIDDIGVAAKASFSKVTESTNGASIGVRNLRKAHTELTDEQERAQKQADQFVSSLAAQTTAVQNQQSQELEQLKTFYEYKEAIATEAEDKDYDIKRERAMEFYDDRYVLLEENYQRELALIERSKLDEETKANALIAIKKKYAQDVDKIQTDQAKRDKELRLAEKKQIEQQNEFKISATANLFGALSSLAALGGREGFEISKAFATAEAITSAYLAITKTLADGGPYPFNLVAASAIGIQAFANVVRIQNQKPPTFADGGIVGGSSTFGDRVTAQVNSGEMILNKTQQKNLLDIATYGQGSANQSDISETLKYVVNKIDAITTTPITVHVDGVELFNLTRQQLAAGRSY